jgi:phosphatidylserine decarboxylase
MPFLTNLIHPEGWRFIGIFGGVTLVLALISPYLFFIGLVLTGWCAYFFRTPERVTPIKEGLVISPADGRVVLIERVVPHESLKLGSLERWRVSIFLNVFDVHANRIPIDGEIKDVIYHPGQFLNASLDKASEKNERNTLVIEFKNPKTKKKDTLGVVQIAGLIARRIRCDVEEDQKVKAGQTYGIIRFGSRADVYLPEDVHPLVIVGQRMIAGETILADLTRDYDQPFGEVR